jgi:hypothetical protein
MSATMTYRPGAGSLSGAWDHLEETVDRLADVVESLLVGSGEFVCSLGFEEAEALAELLDAGHHTRTAARLMHRWVLTEPDWGDDAEHFDTLQQWLALSLEPVRGR